MSSACFSTHFVDTQRKRGVEHGEWRSFFFWGLVGDVELNVAPLCSTGVAAVEINQNVGTWFVSLITIGIYSPQILVVTCAAAPGAPSERVAIELDSQGNPTLIEKQIGGVALSGAAVPDAASPGRWRVALAENRR